MLDLLLHSGSNVGIILLRDLVTERAIDEWTAARLVAYAGAYVKEPSETLVQAVQQMQNKEFWPEAEMFHRAAVLAVSSLIGKTCSASSPSSPSCTSVRIQDWQKKYLDIFTGKYTNERLYISVTKKMMEMRVNDCSIGIVLCGEGTLRSRTAQHRLRHVECTRCAA